MIYPGDFSLTLREDIDRNMGIQEMDDNLKFLNNLASSGASGTSGTSGASGLSGTSGTSGTSGASGLSGTSGTSGTSGLSGTSGTSGTSGLSGTSGTSGASGLSGSSGTSGTRGTSGTSGLSGSSGTSGTRGTSGTSGLGFTSRGEWSDIIVYYVNDVVELEGSSYVCIQSSVGYSPIDYPQFWPLLAAKGSVGPTGPAGPTGLPEGYATLGTNTFLSDQTIEGLIINERSVYGVHNIGSTQNGMMVGPVQLESSGNINIEDGGVFIII